jgi:hypothetical protein
MEAVTAEHEVTPDLLTGRQKDHRSPGDAHLLHRATEGDITPCGAERVDEIGQRADIAAVHAGRGDATERAGGAGRRGGHEDGDGSAVDTK